MTERVDHLDTDVTGAHDDRGAHAAAIELFLHGEAVLHGVQHVHSWEVESLDRRQDRHRAGADHEPVVVERELGALRLAR